ncbi:MAG: hypothetical protein NVS3B18_16530 [Candidatus Dormibacteria bacterium]
MSTMARSSTAALFGSETLGNVLASLLAAPTRPLAQADLVRYWSHHKLTGQRALDRAVASGLVRREGAGRTLRYTARPAAPDFHAARELAVGDQLRRRLHGLSERSGAYIFGSFAARTDTPESDIDILLIGDLDRAAFQQDFWQLELRLGRSVNVVEYGWGDFQRRVAEGSRFLSGLLTRPLLTVVGPPFADLVEAASVAGAGR